jgi:hypothetical protein
LWNLDKTFYFLIGKITEGQAMKYSRYGIKRRYYNITLKFLHYLLNQ